MPRLGLGAVAPHLCPGGRYGGGHRAAPVVLSCGRHRRQQPQRQKHRRDSSQAHGSLFTGSLRRLQARGGRRTRSHRQTIAFYVPPTEQAVVVPPAGLEPAISCVKAVREGRRIPVRLWNLLQNQACASGRRRLTAIWRSLRVPPGACPQTRRRQCVVGSGTVRLRIRRNIRWLPSGMTPWPTMSPWALM